MCLNVCGYECGYVYYLLMCVDTCRCVWICVDLTLGGYMWKYVWMCVDMSVKVWIRVNVSRCACGYECGCVWDTY